jgi:group I intron endonuclease
MADVAHLYKITNTVNDMVYIGVTKNPHHRMIAHACTVTPTKSILKNAMKKYGRDKFALHVLLTSTQEYCYEMERKAIEAYNTLKPNGYNICTGGRGAIGIYGEKNGMFGRKHSSETLEKMRQIRLGKKLSEETKLKMSEARLGQKRSVESCELMKQIALNRSPELLAKMKQARAIARARKKESKVNHVS